MHTKKIHDPRSTPSGRKVKSPERERRREKITLLIMATYVCHAVRTAQALRSTNVLTINRIFFLRINSYTVFRKNANCNCNYSDGYLMYLTVASEVDFNG